MSRKSFFDHELIFSRNICHGSDSPESAKKEIALVGHERVKECLAYSSSGSLRLDPLPSTSWPMRPGFTSKFIQRCFIASMLS